MKTRILPLLIPFLLFFFENSAQTPGIIVRPAGTAGPSVLDRNVNGYTSLTTAGFGNNDISNSEIPYKVVAPVISEPTGDLLRGPSGSFSDIVKTFDGSGFYLFNDTVNLLCRLRIGGIVSGSKGYSVLIDTDQKFGPSGPYADPNYQAATTGSNGNPGFELEVVLETNFRIAIYNVDGTSTPVLMASFPLSSNSQISVASTTDGGNPDYFYDFYVPFSAMGITSSTPIRVTATTVMSPGPAIGGPKSDVYGLGGPNYMDDWISVILHQPVFTADSLYPTRGGIGAVCTQPPTINDPITPSTGFVTGNWTKSVYSSLSTATITLYNGATLIGSTTVASGGSWSIPVTGLVNNNIISAKAQATGESRCLTSNEVTVSSCNSTTHTALPVITCSSIRGFEGTMVTGASVKLYKLTSAGYSLYADDATTFYKITYPSTTTWRYDDINTQSGSACSGGASDVPAGGYVAVALLAPNCVSLPAFECIPGTTVPSTPVITSMLVDGASSIAGSTSPGAGVNLWINGYFIQSVTASGSGVFTFTLTKKLALTQAVEINAATTGSCASTSFTGTVSCFVAAPVIDANANGKVTTGSQLSGTAAAVAGTTVTIYNSATMAIVGTTTLQPNGTWLLSSPVVVSATSYLAKLTGTVCGNSLLSDTVTAITGTLVARCGTITGPVSESVTSVSGTVTTIVANTTVTLYGDGVAIGSTLIGGTAWTIPVNTTVYNTIYAGVVLTIGITENLKSEIFCAASLIVSCNPPSTPVVSPLSTSISVGQSVTYTVTSAQTGILYSLRDNADAVNMGSSVFGNGASANIISDPFNVAGTYTVKIKATSLSGANCISTANATVIVSGTLPLSLVNFKGNYENKNVNLNWETTFEQDIQSFEIERSFTARDFKKIGSVSASGNSQVLQQYTFIDADVKATTLYYRLKIIDNSVEGYKYSKILILRTDKGIVINQVSPNPFLQTINIELYASAQLNLLIRLTDVAGRQVKSMIFSAKKGSNQISLPDLQALANGIYLLEIIGNEDKLFRQLLLKK